ncbi:MAG: bifunctional pyr operon transcriptional regulator/uracil phosphoribosyltransferase PyrR [Verrucomicrobia bacterium]|nr:bifunctional pyr operon transcriptional regulator/uracil phosphoribosyltransferase PyrR [Verrucomicrobiota bacterium]
MNGLLLDSTALQRVIARMAHEIAERNPQSNLLALVGVQKGGVSLSRRLATALERILGHPVPTGLLDVSLYRDDLSQRAAPDIQPTHLPFDPTGRTVVLVDDVLFTGRTTRAALDALHDLGRPQKVQLAVLMDRGHRELPIRADFVGKNVPTSLQQRIDVRLAEDGGDDSVTLREVVS